MNKNLFYLRRLLKGIAKPLSNLLLKQISMKKGFIINFLLFFLLYNVLGQETMNTEYQYKTVSEQELEQVKFKKNRFTIQLDLPGFEFSIGDNKWYETNIFKSVAMGFDYNFSEIISLGFYASYLNDYTRYIESKIEWKHQTLNFAPIFKVNLGKNQMIIPFLTASYTFSLGKWYCNYEENYTPNYVRHIISGGIGLKIYASRWFKKTKYKNNFGIECSFSKAFFLFDNSIYVPLIDRITEKYSFFYKF